MSKQFHEGDLVEAVKDKTVIRGPLSRTEWNERLGIALVESWYSLATLAQCGFELTIVEKTAPRRPWLDAEIGETWHLEPFGCEYNVVGTGTKNWFTRSTVYGSVESVPLDEVGITSAVKLEPVPVTAKKVLDAIRGRIGSIDSAYDFQAVATRFGVTES